MCEVMARRLYQMSDTMPFAGLSASDSESVRVTSEVSRMSLVCRALNRKQEPSPIAVVGRT